MDRAGGAKAIADGLKDLDEFPTPDEAPEFYVDYGETGPVRRRDRRVGVRDMMTLEPNDRSPSRCRSYTDDGAGRAQPRVRARCRRRRSSSGRSTTSRPHLCLTASMTDAVLIDLAVKVDPAIEVVFIDTGYHFPETLETVEEVRRRYGLNLRMMTVARQDEELWKVDPENCCSAVKVGQLDRALAGKAAWMSGLRRAEAASRESRRRSSPATSAAW